MTPPEHPEGGGDADSTSNGAASQSPPWQRVADDLGEEAPAQGRTAYLQGYQEPFPSGQLSESDRHEYDDRMSHTGDLPVVSGVAASRLFGDSYTDTGTQTAVMANAETSTSKGRETVDVASAGARGRSAPSALRRPGRGPRRASLQVKRIDPWSVLKLSLVLGVAMFLVWMVAVGLLYIVLDGMGVWDKLNGTYSSLVSGEGANSVAEPLISAGRVFGIAAIVGMVNIVLLSALATVSAFIYNVSADLAGGLEVTLSERE